MTWHGLACVAALGCLLPSGCFEESDPVGADTNDASDSDLTDDDDDGDDDGDDDDSPDSTGAGVTTDSPGTDADPDTGTSDDSGDDATTAGDIPDNAVVVYATQPVSSDLAGSAGGRSLVEHVDLQCRQPLPFSEFACTQARAVMRLPRFEIMNIDLPQDRPFHAPSGDLIADGPGPFLSGNFEDTPAAAGVLPDPSQFWTGAGPPPAADCMGWTGMGDGAVGNTTAAGFAWLANTTVPCAEARPLLCVCWAE